MARQQRVGPGGRGGAIAAAPPVPPTLGAPIAVRFAAPIIFFTVAQTVAFFAFAERRSGHLAHLNPQAAGGGLDESIWWELCASPEWLFRDMYDDFAVRCEHDSNACFVRSGGSISEFKRISLTRFDPEARCFTGEGPVLFRGTLYDQCAYEFGIGERTGNLRLSMTFDLHRLDLLLLPSEDIVHADAMRPHPKIVFEP